MSSENPDKYIGLQICRTAIRLAIGSVRMFAWLLVFHPNGSDLCKDPIQNNAYQAYLRVSALSLLFWCSGPCFGSYTVATLVMGLSLYLQVPCEDSNCSSYILADVCISGTVLLGYLMVIIHRLWCRKSTTNINKPLQSELLREEHPSKLLAGKQVQLV